MLVAEDDEAAAQLVRHTLGVEFDVRLATNGREALELARVTPLPDVILLDVEMPGIDGFDVATRLRHDSAFHAAPIIFVTARDQPRDVLTGTQRGARFYITKPFKIGDLLDKVRRAAHAGG